MIAVAHEHEICHTGHPGGGRDPVVDLGRCPEHAAPGVPLRKALAAQAGATLLVLLLATQAPSDLRQSSMLLAWALAQGVLAASLGQALRMESWWLAIHLSFAPGLAWALGLGVAPVYPLAAFAALALLYSGVASSRVPLYLSSRTAARALADLLPSRDGFAFIDLGCGLGGVLGYLARARPMGRYCGVELALAPFLLGWLRSRLSGRPFDVRYADMRNIDLTPYDVVYAYLSPAAMPGLWEQARRQMRPGSLLISNSFAVPGVPAAATRSTGARDGSRLLLWRM